jgi:hypothetical protein
MDPASKHSRRFTGDPPVNCAPTRFVVISIAGWMNHQSYPIVCRLQIVQLPAF